MIQMRLLMTCVLALFLSGCAGFWKPINEHVMFTDESWAKSQKHTNVQAVVLEDEEYSFLRLRGLETVAGIGPAEQPYRRVALFMVHSEGGKPFIGFKGFMRFVAIVPDGMPLLKVGDLVEARFGTVYDNLKGFAATGEGTAVLRMLCPTTTSKSQADAFKACAQVLPWHEEWGEGSRYFDGVLAVPSGRPYAASLKDHTELSFHPYYGTDGKPLPTAVPPSVRPDIASWPLPKRY